MKILLINSPFYSGEKKRISRSFPLGLGYLAATLLKNKINVETLDLSALEMNSDEVEARIKNFKGDLIGISALSTQYKYVKWLSRLIKKHRDIPIVLGNALATFNSTLVLRGTCVDICVIEEGEITFLNILKNLEALENVKGIVFKRNDSIVANPAQEYTQDLDTIDFPLRDIFPIEVYLKNSYIHGWPFNNLRIANIIAGRGCPYSCNFCSKIFKGTRLRSIPNIIKEVKFLKEKYNIKGLIFNDELLVINKKRVHELSDVIKPLGLKWQCQGRVDVVDKELLKHMKDAGCVSVGYGIESGSQKILQNMNKGIDISQSIKVIRDTMEAGIFPHIQMIYGYIGENDETVRQTIEFFSRIRCDHAGFFIATPLPNTQLMDYAIKKGFVRDEESYLESLESGYLPDKRDYINLSEFSDDVFLEKKKNMEESIVNNYRRYSRSIPGIWDRYLHYYKKYGIVNGLKLFSQRVNRSWKIEIVKN